MERGGDDAAQSDSAGSPWRQLLTPEELARRGLSMATLAEKVEVTASYLRLVRQGKRSPSPEKARLLLEALGYRVEQEPSERAGFDLTATDRRGRAIHVEMKRRSPRHPIEDRLGEVVEATTDVQNRLEQVEKLGKSLLRMSSEGQITGISLLRPVPGPPASGAVGGLAGLSWPGLISAAARQVHRPRHETQSGESPLRREAEGLLNSVAEGDLPLVVAYLRVLLERAESRSAARRSHHPNEDHNSGG